MNEENKKRKARQGQDINRQGTDQPDKAESQAENTDETEEKRTQGGGSPTGGTR